MNIKLLSLFTFIALLCISFSTLYADWQPGLRYGVFDGATTETYTTNDCPAETEAILGVTKWDSVDRRVHIYQGRIYLESDKTIWLKGGFDDLFSITISNSKTNLQCKAANLCRTASTSFVLEDTGWYNIDIRLLDTGGGAGVISGGPVNIDEALIVCGFRYGGESDTDGAYTPFVDSGDGSLLVSDDGTGFAETLLVTTDNLDYLIGTPSPDYGYTNNLDGSEITLSAPAYASYRGRQYRCSGYTIADMEELSEKVTNVVCDVTFDESDTEAVRSVAYTHPGRLQSITWHWEATGISLSPVVYGAGTIEGTGTYAEGETKTLTAKPGAGYIFHHWAGLPDDVDSTSPFIELTVAPYPDFTAYFSRDHYVTNDTSSLTAPDGLSPTNPYSLAEAIENLSFYDTVYLLPGRYEVSSAITPPQGTCFTAYDASAELPIIDGNEGSHNIFILENPDAIVSSLIFEDSNSQSKGTINLTDGIVTNCTFRSCDYSYGGEGGAIYQLGGLSTHCTITNNYTAGNSGVAGLTIKGGIAQYHSICYNSGGGDCATAGVNLQGGTVSHCDISHNTSVGHQSGDDNTGAAVRMLGGTLTHSRITFNQGTRSDNYYVTGGIYLYGAGTVRACLIYGNTSASPKTGGVGGIRIRGNASALVEHCTIARNYNTQCSDNDGVVIEKGTIRNCIIWGNQVTSADTDLNHVGGTVENCIFPNNSDTTLAQDPAFVDMDAGDLRIRYGSPAIDKAAASEANALDLNGNARAALTEASSELPYDIGAYEYVLEEGQAFPVSITTDGITEYHDSDTITIAIAMPDTVTLKEATLTITNQKGEELTPITQTTKENIATTLPAGLYTLTLTATDSQDRTETTVPLAIKVLPLKTYASPTPLATSAWPYNTPKTAASSPEEALEAIYKGTETTSTLYLLPGRHIVTNTLSISSSTTIAPTDNTQETILDAEGKSLTILALYHDKAKVTSLSIQNANPVNSLPHDSGAIYLAAGTITNCIIRNNNMTKSRYAPIIQAGGLITDCTMTNNFANTDYCTSVLYSTGGALENCLIEDNHSPNHHAISTIYLKGGTIRTSTIANNTGAGHHGGVDRTGIAAKIESGLIESCHIFGNASHKSTYAVSGGIYMSGGTVRNCYIHDNTTPSQGSGGGSGIGGAGGIEVEGANALLESSTILNNHCTSAQNTKQNVYLENGTVKNCIIWGDDLSKTNLAYVSSKSGNITYTCAPEAPEANIGNSQTTPKFVPGTTIPSRTAKHLYNAGIGADWMNGATDLAGKPRIHLKAPDIGAFENNNTPTIMRLE